MSRKPISRSKRSDSDHESPKKKLRSESSIHTVVNSQSHDVQTFESETQIGNNRYWLKQDDIADIARLEYHYRRSGTYTWFEIVGSIEHLSNQLAEFQSKVNQENETRPLTLIVNLGNVHWVTLVIAHQSGQFYGYYVDSMGTEMPNDVRRTLYQAQVLSIDFPIHQQTDGHNCGLWALENANNLNSLLRAGRPFYEMTSQLKNDQRSEEYFEARRQYFAETLGKDEERQARQPTLEMHVQLQPTGQQASVGLLLVQQSAQPKRKAEDSENPLTKKSKSIAQHESQPSYMVNTDPKASIASRKRLRPSENKDNVRAKRPGIFSGQPNEYSASGLKHTLHGNIYQLKLLMLFAWRGYQKKYHFKLATEMDAAEKFDDLVFRYTNNKEDGTDKGTVYRFLQAKHKQEELNKITINDLLTEDIKGEFGLQKYFISYRKIKQNPEFRVGSLKDFIICTNIDFKFGDSLGDFKLNHDIFDQKEDADDILNVQGKKEAVRYKFKSDFSGKRERIVPVLENVSDLKRLAKKLVEYVEDKKDQKIELRDELLKRYHIALAEEKVIDIKNQKFHNNFIKNEQLLPTVERLREEVLSILAQSKNRKHAANMDSPQQKIEKTKLNISNNFGKTDPKLTKAIEFAKEIADLLNASNSRLRRIVKIDRSKELIKNNIDKLVNHVLIEKDSKIQFNPTFFSNDYKLPGNLEDFKNQLKEELASKGIPFSESEQNQYTFDIEHFPKLNLPGPDDKVTDIEINEFFNHLIFAVNQPNEIELGQIIENELGKEFNFISYDAIYNRLLKVMQDWMKDRKGRFFSHKEAKNFFEDAKREINILVAKLDKIEADIQETKQNTEELKAFMTGRDLVKEMEQTKKIYKEGKLVGVTSAYLDDVKELDINFNDAIGLSAFLESHNHHVFYVPIQGNSLLARLKIRSIFVDLKNKAKKEDIKYKYTGDERNYIFLKLSTLLFLKNEYGTAIIKSFTTEEKSNLLLIDCQSEIDIDETTKILFKEELFHSLGADSNKKIILITQKESKLDDFISDFLKEELRDNYLIKAGEEFKFSRDLTCISKKGLLKKMVIFQEQEMPLSRLIGVSTNADGLSNNELSQLDQVVNAETLLALTDQNRVLVGSKPLNFSDLESAYHKVYIEIDEERLRENFYEEEEDYDLFVIGGMSRDEFIETLKASTGNAPKKISDLKIKSKVRLLEDRDPNQNEPIQFILLRPNPAEKSLEDFKKLCRTYPRKRIHFIEKQEDTLFWNRYYDPTFYIDRQFNDQIAVKKGLLKQVTRSKLTEVKEKSPLAEETAKLNALSLAVSGTSEEELSTLFGVTKDRIGSKSDVNQPIFLLSPDPVEAEKEFKTLCDQARGQSVHWLKVKRTKGEPTLIWHRTHGHLDTLREYIYRAKPNMDRLNEEELGWVRDKVVIIADDPGMGKSTTLTHLSDWLSKQEAEWVIRINLNDCKELIKRKPWEQPLGSMDEALDFFSEIDRSGLKQSLAKGLFRYRLEEGGHISLLFDGFDEIDSEVQIGNLQVKIIHLLQFLKDHTRAKIWITTRKHKQETLENALSTLATVFEEFSLYNQKEFMKQFWRKGLTLNHGQHYFSGSQPESERLEHQLTAYTNALLKKISEVIRHEEAKFLGIPLQMRLLAEVFQEPFNKFLKSEANIPEFEKMNLLDLYENFIKKRCDIYFKEKRNNQYSPYEKDRLRRSFNKDHRHLAFQFLFSESEPQYVQNILQNKLPSREDQKTLNRVGIMMQSKTGQVDFIHHTFAEYFVADFLAHQLDKRDNLYGQVKAFLRKQFFEYRNEMVRILLDRLLAKDSPSHMAALDGDRNSLLGLEVNRHDKLGRIPLHLAASYGHKEVVEFLIRQDQSKDSMTECDDLGLGLLSYALLSRKQAVFDLIWRKATTDQKQTMVAAGDYAAFKEIVRSGNDDVTKLLLEQATTDQKQALVNALSSDDYAVFKDTVRRGRYGDAKMIELLLKQAIPSQKKALVSVMINAVSAENYAVFKDTMRRGHFSDAAMVQATPTQKEALGNTVSAEDYAVFKEIVRRGDDDMVKLLLEQATPTQKKALGNAVSAEGYSLFKDTVRRGRYKDIKMIELLLEHVTPTQKKALVSVMMNAVSAENYAVFKGTVLRGDENMVQLLLKQATPTQKEVLVKMMMYAVSAEDYALFKDTVRRGRYEDVKMIELLMEQAIPTQKEALVSVMMNAVSADNYAVFKDAVLRGDATMVQLLLKQATPTQKEVLVKMIMNAVSAEDYSLFKGTVWRGRYEDVKMIELLMEQAIPTQKEALVSVMMNAVSAENYAVFKDTVLRGDATMVQLLLEQATPTQKEVLVKMMMNAVSAEDYALFKGTVWRGRHGDAAMVQLLLEQAIPTQKEVLVKMMMNAVSAEDYALFKGTVWRGRYKDFKMIELLLEQATPTQKKALVSVMMNAMSAENYAVFKGTMLRGDENMVQLLLKQATPTQKEVLVKMMMSAVSAENYAVFKDTLLRGDATMVQLLLEKATPTQKEVLVKMIMSAVSAEDYALFKGTVWRGRYKDFKMIELLLEQAIPTQKKVLVRVMMIAVSAENYAVFKGTVLRGDENMVQLLLKQATPTQKEVLVKLMMNAVIAENYALFKDTIWRGRYGDAAMVQLLLKQAIPTQKEALVSVMMNAVSAENYAVFKDTVLRGDSAMVQLLLEQATPTHKEVLVKLMMNAVSGEDYALFKDTIRRGRYKDVIIIELLLEQATPTQKKAMVSVIMNAVSADNYAVFKGTVWRGRYEDVKMIKLLLEQAIPTQKEALVNVMMNAVSSENYAVFKGTVRSGDIFSYLMVKLFLEQATPTQKEAMVSVIMNVVSEENYAVFNDTVLRGYPAMVQLLLDQATSTQKKALVSVMMNAVSAENYAVFKDTMLRSDAAMVQLLLDQATPTHKEVLVKLMMNAVSADDYAVFKDTVLRGDSAMVQLLLEQATPTQKKALVSVIMNAVSAEDYALFKGTVCRGRYEDVKIIKLLLEQAIPTQKEALVSVMMNAVSAENYAVFKGTVRRGDIFSYLMVELFLEQATPTQKEAMVSVIMNVVSEENYAVFNDTVLRGHPAMVQLLLDQATSTQRKVLVSVMMNAVSAENYAVFKDNMLRGDAAMVQLLLDQATPTHKEVLVKMIINAVSAEDYALFKDTVWRGRYEDVKMIKLLLEQAIPTHKEALVSVMINAVSADDYAVFKNIVRRRDTFSYLRVELLLEQATTIQKEALGSVMMNVVIAEDYALFKDTVRRGDENMVQLLLKQATPTHKKALVKMLINAVSAEDYAFFKDTVRRGRYADVKLIELLLEQATPTHKEALVNVMMNVVIAEDYALFKDTVRRGDENMVQLLLKQATPTHNEALVKRLMNVVSAEDYALFKDTVRRGRYADVKLIELLLEQATPTHKEALVNVMMNVVIAEDYALFKDTVRRGDENMVQLLLKQATPTHNEALVKRLMNVVSAEDYALFKDTVLRGRYADVKMIELLLEQATPTHKEALVNVMMNVVIAEDYALFKDTVRRGDHDMVKLLLEQATSTQKEVLLHAFIEEDYVVFKNTERRGSIRMIQVILEYANSKHRQAMWSIYIASMDSQLLDLANEIKRLLRAAATSGYLEVVKLCLEQEADVLEKNNHDTLLHQAVSGNNPEIIKLILNTIKEKLIDDSQACYQAINAKDTEGHTPLMWAAQKGIVNAARTLLEYDVDVNAENNGGLTALHWSAKGGHLEVVRTLLQRDADVNALDNDNQTPLHLAVQKNQLAVAVILLEHGAKIDVLDEHQQMWVAKFMSNQQPEEPI